jgi:hypothetical protein
MGASIANKESFEAGSSEEWRLSALQKAEKMV